MNRPTAIVTGASSGIGKAFTRRLADEGYHVFPLSRESSHYRHCLGEWSEYDNITPLEGDITSDAALKGIFSIIELATPRVDLLINNAGAYFSGDGGLPSPEVVLQNLEINFLAHYRVIRYALPLLEKAPRPVILNVTSGAGSLSAVNGPGPLAYRVSKAATNMMTRSLAYELRDKHIAVHAADPGWVKTRLNPDGTDTPENAVSGMWHLVHLHDLNASGQFWFWGKVIPW